MLSLQPLFSKDDLLRCSLGQLLMLTPSSFNRILDQEEVTYILQLCDAFWQHDGNPAKPHVLLHAGGHSNGFINMRLVLSYTNFCQIFAHQAIRVIERHFVGLRDLRGTELHIWPLGSSTAAADLSKDVANAVDGRHDVFLSEENKQTWKGPQIPKDDLVIQIEELMTTATTTLAVRNGLRNAHSYPINFAPFVFTLIHRSELYEIQGWPVYFLAHYDIWNAKPEECDLCKQGSEAIPAKGPNWLRLTGRA